MGRQLRRPLRTLSRRSGLSRRTETLAGDVPRLLHGLIPLRMGFQRHHPHQTLAPQERDFRPGSLRRRLRRDCLRLGLHRPRRFAALPHGLRPRRRPPPRRFRSHPRGPRDFHGARGEEKDLRLRVPRRPHRQGDMGREEHGQRHRPRPHRRHQRQMERPRSLAGLAF